MLRAEIGERARHYVVRLGLPVVGQLPSALACFRPCGAAESQQILSAEPPRTPTRREAGGSRATELFEAVGSALSMRRGRAFHHLSVHEAPQEPALRVRQVTKGDGHDADIAGLPYGRCTGGCECHTGTPRRLRLQRKRQRIRTRGRFRYGWSCAHRRNRREH
ncbi:hypothetical protein STPH1_7286 [Streptomyces sp. OM5714]|nr:hypothetical protein STPH1_7286 [Streptomyces sp. OM5714]